MYRYVTVLDPDLEIMGAQSQDVLALQASVWSKNNGGGPSLDPPLYKVKTDALTQFPLFQRCQLSGI